MGKNKLISNKNIYCKNNNIKLIQLLINNCKTKRQYNELMAKIFSLSIILNNIKLVEQFINDINFNYRNNIYLWTSISAGNLDIVKLILSKYTKSDVSNVINRISFIINDNILKLLFEHAEPSHLSIENLNTLLYLAMIIFLS